MSLRLTSILLHVFCVKVVEEVKVIMRLRTSFDGMKDFVDILLRLQNDHMLEFEFTQNNVKAYLTRQILFFFTKSREKANNSKKLTIEQQAEKESSRDGVV